MRYLKGLREYVYRGVVRGDTKLGGGINPKTYPGVIP